MLPFGANPGQNGPVGAPPPTPMPAPSPVPTNAPPPAQINPDLPGQMGTPSLAQLGPMAIPAQGQMMLPNGHTLSSGLGYVSIQGATRFRNVYEYERHT